MIYSCLKNTFPALCIVWTVFLIEFFSWGRIPKGDSSIYIFIIQLFISYTVLGLITGGLSAGILAKKQKKYSYTFENDIKKYSKYFFKNFGISFLALFSLVSREVINNPLIYNSTLLDNSFWMSWIFSFIRDKFSPLYFTVFFVIIIIMSIHNLLKNLSLYHGKQRAAGYISALILSALLIFNYGYLNAVEKRGLKNIVMIGVEDLEGSQLSLHKLKDKPALKKLREHSYDFINCFTPVLDPQAALLSVLTSSDPEKNLFEDGLLRSYPQSMTVFEIYNDSLFRAGNLSDIRFRYERSKAENGNYPAPPTSEDIAKSEILGGYIFSPVIFNSVSRINLFPEALLMNGYRDRTLLKKSVSQVKGNGNGRYIILYTIPDYKDNLPYPYYRLADTDPDDAYLNYLNDEVAMIYEQLEGKSVSDDPVICLFGMPGRKSGLKSKGYKIPFFLSSKEYSIERKVKNRYTTMDILPTVLDAAGVNIKNYGFEGKSFFDPEFIRQDIVLTDVFELNENKNSVLYSKEGFKSKNLPLQAEIFPLLPRSLISGELKLNAVPSPHGIKYELYDLEKDREEINDISSANPAALKKMKEVLELKIRKDLGAKVINGSFFK